MNDMPEMTFEDAMKRLEEIVHLLEKGEVSLEESLRLYREGALCSRYCRDKLEHAEHELKIWQDDMPDKDESGDDEQVRI